MELEPGKIIVPMKIYNDMLIETSFYRERVKFLEEEIERFKNPLKYRIKKSAAVKKPVSKTGNLIHFPVGKENKKENPCR